MVDRSDPVESEIGESFPYSYLPLGKHVLC